MGIEIQWNSAVIRCGDETYTGEPGSSAVFSFAVNLFAMGDTAYLYAARGEFSKSMFKLIASTLKEQGFKKVIWQRLNQPAVRGREVIL